MTKEETQTHAFGFKIQKKNPKPDAPTYRLETMNDLYQLVTTENVDRLFEDLKNMFTLIALQKEAIDAMHPNGSKEITMPYFEWIDD